MIVIADTSPINYLILIGEIDVLPALYDSVLIPPSVREELGRPRLRSDGGGLPGAPPGLKCANPEALPIRVSPTSTPANATRFSWPKNSTPIN